MSNTTTAPAIVTVTRGQGRAIHAAYTNSEGQPWGTYCAASTLMGGRSDLRLRRVAGEVTCKSCLKGMAPAPAAEEAPELVDLTKPVEPMTPEEVATARAQWAKGAPASTPAGRLEAARAVLRGVSRRGSAKAIDAAMARVRELEAELAAAEALTAAEAARLEAAAAEEFTACSYCYRPATHVGDGQDGDLYCAEHLVHAWNGATRFAPEPEAAPVKVARPVAEAARLEAAAEGGRNPMMACYAMHLPTGRVCSLEFGHDGDHEAHGPGARVITAWERTATDRTATEVEEEAAKLPDEHADNYAVCTAYGCGRPFDTELRRAHWNAYGHMPEPEAPRPVGRPAVGKLRTVRVSDEVWEAAAAVAAARGTTLSEVIRESLEVYARDELFTRRMAALRPADAAEYDRRGDMTR